MARPALSRTALGPVLGRALAVTLVLAFAVAPTGAAAASGPPTLSQAPNCPVFPSTNVWNKRVDQLSVASNSDAVMRSIGLGAYLHPDFSSTAGGNYGIPFNVVGTATKRKAVRFTWPNESDRGPYPIPRRPKVEGGSDRHILMVDKDACVLYELFAARKTSTGWRAGSGAIWNMRSDALRPVGWTSADAAGLPILPGLARYDEVAAGEIRHALRFTAEITRRAYIYPARHYASDDTGASLPPMGLRVRLKSTVDISGFGPQARVILRALQLYGMILADNGSSMYVTGAPAAGWDDDDLHDLHQLHGSDFEVVDTSSLRNGYRCRAAQPALTPAPSPRMSRPDDIFRSPWSNHHQKSPLRDIWRANRGKSGDSRPIHGFRSRGGRLWPTFDRNQSPRR